MNWCWIVINLKPICCRCLTNLLQNTNSLCPNDTIWWYRTGSSLTQVMACCLMAPSHYLTNVDLSSVKSCDNQLRVISPDTSITSYKKLCCKLLIKNHSNPTGAIEFMKKLAYPFSKCGFMYPFCCSPLRPYMEWGFNLFQCAKAFCQLRPAFILHCGQLRTAVFWEF